MSGHVRLQAIRLANERDGHDELIRLLLRMDGRVESQFHRRLWLLFRSIASSLLLLLVSPIECRVEASKQASIVTLLSARLDVLSFSIYVCVCVCVCVMRICIHA